MSLWLSRAFERRVHRLKGLPEDLLEAIEAAKMEPQFEESARAGRRNAAATREAVERWNSLDERHGCFADEHSTL